MSFKWLEIFIEMEQCMAVMNTVSCYDCIYGFSNGNSLIS